MNPIDCANDNLAPFWYDDCDSCSILSQITNDATSFD